MGTEQLLNILWTLLGAVLVFFMQAGFAMVETGFTRSKNAGNIIMKNLMDFALGAIIYFVLGFGLMFGDSFIGLIGTSGFIDPTKMTNVIQFFDLTPETFIIFQTVFCATAATIVSGAMAERTKFISYCIYSVVISAVIYPVVGHWIWGGGWLSDLGFIDFAGSTVVHSVGGWAAVVGASILGPRIGKYNKDGSPNAILGHNLTVGALGVFILWFGWFGFNAASTLVVSNEIGHIAMTTNLSATAAATTTMIMTWIRYKKPDISLTLNGALAGLVAITAGCQVVTLWGSIMIGIIAGIAVVLIIEVVDKKIKVDDPVGAIGVHCGCGVLGTFLVGLFANYGVGTEGAVVGLLYGGGVSLLITQIIGIVAVAAWTIVTCFILFTAIKKTVGLRVSQEEEIEGLDIHEHGTEAYCDFIHKIDM